VAHGMLLAALLVAAPPAVALPPLHKVVCDGRLCKPGEGNPSVTHNENPYELPIPGLNVTMKGTPHGPMSPEYAPLVSAAHATAMKHLVYLCAADFDFREIAENWHRAARRLGLTNLLIYALDADVYTHLTARALPAVDGSRNLDAWNRTRLQRHIQVAEAERHMAAAAIAAAGLDVLLMESSHVMLRDPSPTLNALAHSSTLSVDTAYPRGLCTSKPNAFAGCGPFWNLVWLRGAGTAEQRERAVSFQVKGVQVGMVDFYLRWWNGAHAIFSGFGKNFQRCASILDGGLTPSDLTNLTTPVVLKLKGGCVEGRGELRMGLLPESFFAQWVLYGPSQGSAAAAAALISRSPKPSQRDRLRLDRYDAQDFTELVAAMKESGLWFLS